MRPFTWYRSGVHFLQQQSTPRNAMVLAQQCLLGSFLAVVQPQECLFGLVPCHA